MTLALPRAFDAFLDLARRRLEGTTMTLRNVDATDPSALLAPGSFEGVVTSTPFCRPGTRGCLKSAGARMSTRLSRGKRAGCLDVRISKLLSQGRPVSAPSRSSRRADFPGGGLLRGRKGLDVNTRNLCSARQGWDERKRMEAEILRGTTVRESIAEMEALCREFEADMLRDDASVLAERTRYLTDFQERLRRLGQWLRREGRAGTV